MKDYTNPQSTHKLEKYLNESMENRGADGGELLELLGRARAKKGMFEGNLEKGELEIGQVSALLKNILPASEIISDIVHSYRKAGGNKLGLRFKF